MTEIVISPCTNWESLPWVKIYTKLYKLQQGIYQASKECNTRKIYTLQKFLIYSNDIKILAIQNVLQNLVKYYFKSNKIKVFFSDHDKWLLYQSLLLCASNNMYNKFIINKVKQYITYACIIPELKAKLGCVQNNIFNFNLDILYMYSFTKFKNSNKYSLYGVYSTLNNEYKFKSVFSYLIINYMNIKK